MVLSMNGLVGKTSTVKIYEHHMKRHRIDEHVVVFQVQVVNTPFAYFVDETNDVSRDDACDPLGKRTFLEKVIEEVNVVLRFFHDQETSLRVDVVVEESRDTLHGLQGVHHIDLVWDACAADLQLYSLSF